MNEKATIYDYVRMCKTFEDCKDCPLNRGLCYVNLLNKEELDEANEIILKWCKKHPVETRQDRFLKMFPNTKINSDGIIMISPCTLEGGETIPKNFPCSPCTDDCVECRKEYWLAEVKENE